MSALDVVESFRKRAVPFGRKVSIAADGSDYVVAYQPQNVIVFRHADAHQLRTLCLKLRWEIVSDSVADPRDLRSW
jgi:hypothetical protein